MKFSTISCTEKTTTEREYAITIKYNTQQLEGTTAIPVVTLIGDRCPIALACPHAFFSACRILAYWRRKDKRPTAGIVASPGSVELNHALATPTGGAAVDTLNPVTGTQKFWVWRALPRTATTLHVAALNQATSLDWRCEWFDSAITYKLLQF